MSELQVVAARHVGKRCAPRGMFLVLRWLGEPSAVQIIGERYARVGGLFGDRDHVGDGTLRHHVAPPHAKLRVAALEQQTVRYGRGPGTLHDAQRGIPDRARLRRRRGHAGTDAGTRSRPVVTWAAALPAVLVDRRAAAVHRVVDIEPDLVARCDLTGQADSVDPAARVIAHAHAIVLGPRPEVWVADFFVCVLILRVDVVARGACVGVEPDPVALDWATQREVAVPILPERRSVGETERAQAVVDIGCLSPLAGPAAKEVSIKVVAAGLGDDVERGCAPVRLPQAA